MADWNKRMLDLAKHVSEWSKDPSTQVGAVITRSNRTIVSVGYNGFPRGVQDWEERLHVREVKYQMMVHAEANAIIHATESLDTLFGTVIYTYPFPPCSACAGLIIQAGIMRVVSPPPTRGQMERWGDSFKLAEQMFDEAGVELVLYGEQ